MILVFEVRVSRGTDIYGITRKPSMIGRLNQLEFLIDFMITDCRCFHVFLTINELGAGE